MWAPFKAIFAFGSREVQKDGLLFKLCGAILGFTTNPSPLPCSGHDHIILG